MKHRTCKHTPITILVLLHFSPSTLTTITTKPKLASAQGLIGPTYVSPTIATSCWIPCVTTPPNANVAVPQSNCNLFYVCRDGKVINKLACSQARAFDVSIGTCNHEALVECVDPTCVPTRSPTRFPTVGPSFSPTEFPTVSPTEFPTAFPTATPTTSPTDSPTESPSASPTISPTITPSFAIPYILSKQSLIEQYVLQSHSATNDNVDYPSIKYAFDDFLNGLRRMGVDGFGADFRFSLWDTDRVMFKYGLVNVAAFLSQAMEEAVGDDTCDELNWQEVAGKHAISNSCGQEGRSYQEETCGIYSCIVDSSMEVTAVSSANQVRAPPPFECRPGSGSGSYAGYWNTHTGMEIKNTPYSNTVGRIDVEGCCYWGRGVLLTRGTCNIGKLNYYLGARAARDGRASIYPNIDFCLDPEATCASSVTNELRWTTALFEWAERVQRYNTKGWAYEDELIKFYDEGMSNDSFIDSVGRIFSRGCHAAGCSNLEVRAANKRKSNFFLILNDIFMIDSIVSPTAKPSSPRPVGSPASVPSNHVRPYNIASEPAPVPVDPNTLRPTPQPSTPPPIQIDPLPPRTPTPSSNTSGQYPTIPDPTVLNPTITTAPATEPPPIFATSRPIGTMPIGQPSGNSDSNVEKDVSTQYPTSLETIIVLVPNGVDRSELLHHWHAIALFGASAFLLSAV